MDCSRWQTVRAALGPSLGTLGSAVLFAHTVHSLEAKASKSGPDTPPETSSSEFPEKQAITYADPFPTPPTAVSGDLVLSPKAQTRVEALALYAAAALVEERDGPANARSLFHSALSLDPANIALALRLAHSLLQEDKPNEALQILKDAHAFAPDQPAPLEELARIYLATLRRPDNALVYAEKAYKLAPDSLSVTAVYLDTCASAQLTQRIEDTLKRSLALQNDRPEFWVQLGSLFRNALTLRSAPGKPIQGRIQELFKKALQLAPDNPVVLEAVSDHYALTQQLAEASTFYQRALQEHRRQNGAVSPAICLKWARVLLLGDQLGAAMALLEELLAEQPSIYEARELLGELHLQQGKLLPALMQFGLALGNPSSTAEDFLRVAQLQLRLKRPKDAVSTAGTGRERFPGHAQLTMIAAIALAETRQHSEALRYFEEAEKQFSASQNTALDAGFYLTFGAAAERAGFPERAEQLLQRSIDLDPENAAEALNYLGFMWVDRNQNLDRAGELIQKALRLRPETPAYLDSLGWWHYRKGRYPDALREIRRALEKTPREEAAEVYDHLGDILEKLSQKEEALEAWKTAHQLNADLPGVWSKIKKAQDNQ
jgi:tetratricopeptide (TPR) repeat protein